ncbi:MAG: preprotein translocase subunit SecG [Pseudomonadales bacterium]|nr:preprotein translocase subunit SecG [Pseudomonadales bacterium]MBO6564018.1 preprotein translocase subunit SecG [Pseudomonadales bacterium]MBO6597460.1 preprotein translocase subunit SecG [Pseudomonadales bacterium]MBO6824194.1 preprotein translocase subunit SecG [Pseudomonadales bacterium]
MDAIETLVLALHVLAALAVTGLVLIQHGKGADMGAGFGAGASATVFGSGGAGNFLTRTTTIIAITFFLTSFGLAYFAKEKSQATAQLGIPTVVEQAPSEQETRPAENELPSIELPADESEIPQG